MKTIMDLSYLRIELTCPICDFAIEVLLKQVIVEETILCQGCLEEIQLVDEGGSRRRAEQQLNNDLDQLSN